MRHLTLVDVLDNPKHPDAQMALRALADALRRFDLDTEGPPRRPGAQPRLGGEDGGLAPLEAWRARRNTDREKFFNYAQLWEFYSDSSARRRDGVSVRSGTPPHLQGRPDPTAGRPWQVEFPGRPGGANLYDLLHAPTLADTIKIVDNRWPCPGWWISIDHELSR